MFEAVTSSPFFGLALTLGCWCLGVELQRRTGLLICNPVLVASLLVIGALTVLRVPLECYNAGGGLVKLMLGPATAVLALNIYQQPAQQQHGAHAGGAARQTPCQHGEKVFPQHLPLLIDIQGQHPGGRAQHQRYQPAPGIVALQGDA